MKSRCWIYMACFLLVAVVWFVGFVQFCHTVFLYPQKTKISISLLNEETAMRKGIVVLTGGRNRIKRALELLQTGSVKNMLISGVEKGITLSHILAQKNVVLRDEDKVELGYQATDTVGNALETRDWADKNDLQQLFVVTSSYHIPRVQLEFERFMPEKQFIFVAVSSDYVLPNWWASPKSFLFLTREYAKYLVVYLQYKVLGL